MRRATAIIRSHVATLLRIIDVTPTTCGYIIGAWEVPTYFRVDIHVDVERKRSNQPHVVYMRMRGQTKHVDTLKDAWEVKPTTCGYIAYF